MTQAPPPAAPLTELKLPQEIKDIVNNGYPTKPLIVAYVDEDGQPSLSIRGSAQAFSDTALAVWIRNPEGGLRKSLEKNPHVTLWYRDTTPETRAMIQFKGIGRIGNDAEREKIYTSAPENEQKADADKKGFGLVVDLEKVDGNAPGMRLAMRK